MSVKLGDMDIIKSKELQEKHTEYVELLERLGDMLVREEQETTFVEHIKSKGGLIWFDFQNLRGRRLTFLGYDSKMDIEGVKSFVSAVLDAYYLTKDELLEKDAAGRTMKTAKLLDTCVNAVYDDL